MATPPEARERVEREKERERERESRERERKRGEREKERCETRRSSPRELPQEVCYDKSSLTKNSNTILIKGYPTC